MVVVAEDRVVVQYSSLGAVVVVDSRNRLKRLHSLRRILLEAHCLRRIEYNDYRPRFYPLLSKLLLMILLVLMLRSFEYDHEHDYSIMLYLLCAP